MRPFPDYHSLFQQAGGLANRIVSQVAAQGRELLRCASLSFICGPVEPQINIKKRRSTAA
jgi:hypothetical protein